MKKKILLLSVCILFFIGFGKTGTFYYSKRVKNLKKHFVVIGSIPTQVEGNFKFKSKTSFKKIIVSYHPSLKKKELRSKNKASALIRVQDGIVNHRFQLAYGKGKYHFSLWGQPGLKGNSSTFLGHFNVFNTSNLLPIKVKLYSRLQLNDSFYKTKYKTADVLTLAGRTSVHFLQVWVIKGSLKAKSVVRIKNGRFKFPLYLRFGKGKYRIIIFGSGEKGLAFSTLGRLDLENSGQLDVRFKAPSPDIQSRHPQIAQLAKKITEGKRGTMAKLRAVYKWITGHIRYDYKTFRSRVMNYRSALDVLNDKTAVCSGYSLLMAALLRNVEIPVRIITGSGKSKSLGNRWVPHAWNQVLVGKRWLNIDATWDAGYRRRAGKLIPRTWRWFSPARRKFFSKHRQYNVLLK